MDGRTDHAQPGVDFPPSAAVGDTDIVPGGSDSFGTADGLCALPTPLSPDGGPDQIDEVIADWHRERPDLDSGALACFARMKMLTKTLADAADRVLRQHGLTPGEFDVLGALRRSGPGCTLIPSQLSALLMMSRAGMTNRLDRLEAAGLIERALDPADRRSFRVRLTEKGHSVVDGAITEHAGLVNRFCEVLSPEQREQFDQSLRSLLHAFR
jgi:DNA-binding MarR family transcriptional regulator